MPETPQDLLKEYERRLATQDFETVRPLIHENAVFWFNDGSYRGIEAIEKAFMGTFELIQDEKYWLTDVDWILLSAESACCHYQYHWEGVIHGTTSSGGGRGTSVLQKNQSSWKIIHEHLSPFPD